MTASNPGRPMHDSTDRSIQGERVTQESASTCWILHWALQGQQPLVQGVTTLHYLPAHITEEGWHWKENVISWLWHETHIYMLVCKLQLEPSWNRGLGASDCIHQAAREASLLGGEDQLLIQQQQRQGNVFFTSQQLPPCSLPMKNGPTRCLRRKRS